MPGQAQVAVQVVAAELEVAEGGEAEALPAEDDGAHPGAQVGHRVAQGQVALEVEGGAVAQAHNTTGQQPLAVATGAAPVPGRARKHEALPGLEAAGAGQPLARQPLQRGGGGDQGEQEREQGGDH